MCQLRVAPFYVPSKFQRGRKSNSEKSIRVMMTTTTKTIMMMMMPAYSKCVQTKTLGKFFDSNAQRPLYFTSVFLLLLLLHTQCVRVCSCVCIAIHDAVPDSYSTFYSCFTLFYLSSTGAVTVAAAAAATAAAYCYC